MAGATPEFKQQLQKAWDSIPAGATFSYRRTFTEGEVTLFCGVTGDFNPYHQDATFAAQSWFGRRIVPGLLTGSMITHIGGLIGFLAREMTFQFTAPVYIGDTITCTITIQEKDEARRIIQASAVYVNQDDKEVLRATFNGFPAQVRLAHQ
jgi:3-hydroxybutyryl-CoA dehydratase